MRDPRLRPLIVAVLFLVCPLSFAASQRPTPEAAQRLLQSRPDLVNQLRQRILTSGLTADQVRARLRAEGYPENLLDPYLNDARITTDSLPNADVYSAIQALGIVDSTDVVQLQQLARTPIDSLLRRPPRGLPAPRSARDTSFLAMPESTTTATTARPDTDRVRRREPAVFGLDLFRRSTSQFEANVAGPVDANYRLGPGDRLVLILTGDVEQARTLDVTREGFIVIPQVGQLYVANLTLDQLNDLLYARLSRVYSGVRRGPDATTRFSVSVASLGVNQIFVVGDVQRPGSYRVSRAGTALTALYAAGGPSDMGSLRRIEVRRGGKPVQSLDVYDYVLAGDASRDVRLETGDVVFVPVHGAQVQIQGEVIRPGTYELLPGETLAELVRMAGGFSPSASRRRVQIQRIVPPSERTMPGRDRYVVDVGPQGMQDGTAPAFALEAGDRVRVFPIAERVRAQVSVTGNVWLDGIQGFVPGMKLSDALRAAGGLRPDTYLGEVLISRLQPDSTRTQLRATLVDTTGTVLNDPVMQEDDAVRVFSLSEFRPERYVAITGAVRRAGRFAYRDGMTIRDLVLLAGGLTPGAYLREVEIARVPLSRAAGVTAVTFRVPIDSTYLFDLTRDGPRAPAPATPGELLHPYDNVLILLQPDWQLQHTVTLGGEVKFPGVYTIRSKQERVIDLLERSGGLTPEAYAEGVQFYRRRGNLGRIGIDLPRALRDRRNRDNLLLEDGDSVYIPRFNPVVNVTGEVNSPVAVAYVPGQTMDYYIRRAGGPSRRADAKHAYVTQPNGSVESRTRALGLFGSTPKPRPGGSVYVPQRDPNDKKDYTAMVGSVASVLASLVAIIAISKR
jgi:polysaccharide biosynthesis/export protein